MLLCLITGLAAALQYILLAPPPFKANFLVALLEIFNSSK